MQLWLQEVSCLEVVKRTKCLLQSHLNSENEPNAAVFPNPTENEFQITVNDKLLSISLFNTLGEKIREFSSTEQTHSIIELANGMYWLEIIDLKNVKYVVKIIKN